MTVCRGCCWLRFVFTLTSVNTQKTLDNIKKLFLELFHRELPGLGAQKLQIWEKDSLCISPALKGFLKGFTFPTLESCSIIHEQPQASAAIPFPGTSLPSLPLPREKYLLQMKIKQYEIEHRKNPQALFLGSLIRNLKTMSLSNPCSLNLEWDLQITVKWNLWLGLPNEGSCFSWAAFTTVPAASTGLQTYRLHTSTSIYSGWGEISTICGWSFLNQFAAHMSQKHVK